MLLWFAIDQDAIPNSSPAPIIGLHSDSLLVSGSSDHSLLVLRHPSPYPFHCMAEPPPIVVSYLKASFWLILASGVAVLTLESKATA